VNIALRAVHDALQGQDEPAHRWAAFIGALSDRAGVQGLVETAGLRAVLSATGCAGTAGEWIGNLRLLGVVDPDGRLDPARATAVGVALELAADSFLPLGPASSWASVATLPPDLRALLHPPPLRQTAGVLLDLVDRAAEDIRLAVPFVDPRAVEFLTEPLIGAGHRGVNVMVVTSTGNAARFAKVAQRWTADRDICARMRVSEVQTALSLLGSHAKVLVVDEERGYVGSANLTTAGLGGHIELGVEVTGPQVADLARVLDALERIATRVLTVG
jgi:phosphatidylserine/phosphatidylglycerophosphate/cardiolipin synthase-like enzyme